MSWANSRRYQRGDPGLFDFIGKAIGGVANLVTGGAAGAVVSGVKAIAGIVGGKRPAPAGPVSPIKAAGGLWGSNLFSQPIRNGGSAVIKAPTLMPTAVTMPGGAVVAVGRAILPPIISGAASGVVQTLLGPGGGSTTGAPVPTQWDGQPGRQAGCPAGYHLNKSGYWTKRYGYIGPGTVCVKSRRRNPLNPRALSRAMSRLTGAQKAIKSIIRFESVAKGGKINAGRRRKR
jgi:hypothetical protein